MNSAFVGYEELSRSRRVLSASAYGLDLLNSSYPTQPHSLLNILRKPNVLISLLSIQNNPLFKNKLKHVSLRRC